MSDVGLTVDPFAYKRDPKLQKKLVAEVLELVRLPGNNSCADCGDTLLIRFCSASIGVFLCKRCYGVHRSLGSHITLAKTLDHDAFHPDEVALLREVGNKKSNAHYLATALPAMKKPRPSAADTEMAVHIREKYAGLKYVAGDGASPGARAKKATRTPVSPSVASAPAPPPQPPTRSGTWVMKEQPASQPARYTSSNPPPPPPRPAPPDLLGEEVTKPTPSEPGFDVFGSIGATAPGNVPANVAAAMGAGGGPAAPPAGVQPGVSPVMSPVLSPVGPSGLPANIAAAMSGQWQREAPRTGMMPPLAQQMSPQQQMMQHQQARGRSPP